MKSIVVNKEEDIPKNSKYIIDIDKGISYLNNFLKNTKSYNKKFLKIEKKLKETGKYISHDSYKNFAKKHLYNEFKEEFFDKMYPEKNFSDYDLNSYIIGIYLVSLKKNVNFNINKIYAKTIQEISEKVIL